jgi:EpsI family protein
MKIITTKTPILSGFSLKPILIGLSMILAAILAMWMKPTHNLVTKNENVNLEAMIPRQFKNWKVDESIAPQLISPDLQASLNKIYDETLSRTYVNEQGERIMLSIAYGGNQSDNLSVHLPEGCYGGQGFAVSDKIDGVMPTNYGNIHVSRLIANKELRNEPITYWIVIGDIPTSSDQWSIKKAKLMYALNRQIADGMLVRISSISPDAEQAYNLQRDFADALLEALTPDQRKRIIGVGDK